MAGWPLLPQQVEAGNDSKVLAASEGSGMMTAPMCHMLLVAVFSFLPLIHTDVPRLRLGASPTGVMLLFVRESVRGAAIALCLAVWDAEGIALQNDVAYQYDYVCFPYTRHEESRSRPSNPH